jgi:hypothetical protein
MDGKPKKVKSLEEPLLATIMHLKTEVAWTLYETIDSLYLKKTHTRNSKMIKSFVDHVMLAQ